MKYFNTDRIKHIGTGLFIINNDLLNINHYLLISFGMWNSPWMQHTDYIGVSYTINCNFIDKIDISYFNAISNVEGPCPILEIPNFNIVMPVPNTNEHLSCVGYRYIGGMHLTGVERLKVYILNHGIRISMLKLSRFINYEYNIYYPDAFTISRFE